MDRTDTSPAGTQRHTLTKGTFHELDRNNSEDFWSGKEIEYLPHGSDSLKLVSLDPLTNVYGYIQCTRKDRTIISNTAAP